MQAGLAVQPAPVRIAIFATGDPLDIGCWSGISQAMVRQLGQHFEIVHIERQPWPRWHPLLVRVVLKASLGRFDLGWCVPYVRLATRGMCRRLRQARPDLVFALSAGEPIPAVAREHRVVNVAGATGPLLTDYYPWYAALTRRRKQAINRGSLAGVRQSFLSVYPSSWAVEAVRRDCALGPAQVVEVPYGGNSTPPADLRERQPGEPLRLLFVGFDWQRKGGPLACAAVRQLRSEGIAAELDVIGRGRPTDVPEDPAIRFHGRLNRTDPAQNAELARLFDDAHLFLLPTHAEAFGLVFAEAAAHGLPSVALRTGGVPSAVRHGETGWLLDPGASAADLAAAIRRIVQDPALYATLSRQARAFAEERLNWDAWGRAVAGVVHARLAQP